MLRLRHTQEQLEHDIRKLNADQLPIFLAKMAKINEPVQQQADARSHTNDSLPTAA